MLCEYVAAIRDAVGIEIPMDHFGHLGVNSIMRFGKAYEKFNLSWMEDAIPGSTRIYSLTSPPKTGLPS